MTVKCVAKFSWIFSVKINYAHLQMHEVKGNLQSKKKKIEKKIDKLGLGVFSRQTPHWEILLRRRSVYLQIPPNQDNKVINYDPWVDASSIGVSLPV